MAFRVRRDQVRGTKSRTLRSTETVTVAWASIGPGTTILAGSTNQQTPGAIIDQTALARSPQLNQQATAPLIDQTASAFAPAASINISPALLVSLAATSDPVVLSGTEYPLIENLGATFSPTLSQVFGWPFLDATGSIYAPDAQIPVYPELLDYTAVTYGPTLHQAFEAALIDQTAQVSEFVAHLGFMPDQIVSTTVVWDPRITWPVYGELIENASALYDWTWKASISPERLGGYSIFSPRPGKVYKPGLIRTALTTVNQYGLTVTEYGNVVHRPRLAKGVNATLIQRLGVTFDARPSQAVRAAVIGTTTTPAEPRVQVPYPWELIGSLTTVFLPKTYRVFAGRIDTHVRYDSVATTKIVFVRASSLARFLGP